MVDEGTCRNTAPSESPAQAVCLIDAEARILEVNDEFTRLFGYQSQEAVGHYLPKLLLANGDFGLRGEGVRRRKDGAHLHVGMMVTTVRSNGRAAYRVVYRDISEQSRLRDRDQEVGKRLRAVWESAPLGIIITRFDGRLVETNPAAQKLLGYTADELLQMRFMDYTFPDDLPGNLAIRQQLQDGKIDRFELEKRYVRKDGKIITGRAVTSRLGEDLIITVIEDITARKQAQEQLRATADRLRAVLEHAPVGIVTGDWQGRFIEANPAFQRITGFSDEELKGMVFMDFTHPDDLPRNLDMMERLKDGDLECYDFEKRYIVRDGRTIWVRVNGSKLDENHKISIIEEITERKQAQAATARLAAVVEGSDDAIWTHTPEGVISDWNAAATRLFGYTAEEAIGKHTALLVPGDRMAELEANMRCIRQGGRIQQMETERLHKDGARVEISLSVSPIVQEGKVLGTAVIAHEIGRRKQMENALHRSEQRFQLAVQATKDLIWDWDLRSGHVWRSAGYWSNFGHEPKRPEPGHQEWLEFVHPEDRERVRNVVESALARHDRSYEYEFRFRRADNSFAHAWCRAAIIGDETGRPVRAVGAVADLSDRFRLEEQLRQAQKLEAVGRLAGGVAHDFNNLLMVVSSYAQMLEECPDPARAQGYVRQILHATERAASLTHQMLAFSRKQVLAPRVLHLNDTVEQTAGMIKRLIGEDIELVFRPGRTLSPIEVDPGQIAQVLMNLCVNARDAMPKGGKIIIETQDTEVDPPNAALHPSFVPGKYVMLTVTDTGVGMTKEVKDRIFEPFFTTKEVGKGTGLGLSTVYGIIKQSGGYIWVYSEPDRGTSFKLYFRPSEKRPESKPVSAATEASQGETILLVEDEEALRGVVSEHLRRRHYRVIEAANGIEALALARSHSGSIDLLLTDVIMPRMSGPELAEALHAVPRREDVTVVYMSGYTDETIINQGMLKRGAPLVQKPFTLAALSSKLQEVLRQKSK